MPLFNLSGLRRDPRGQLDVLPHCCAAALIQSVHQICCLSQSQQTDARLTNPSTDAITQSIWQVTIRMPLHVSDITGLQLIEAEVLPTSPSSQDYSPVFGLSLFSGDDDRAKQQKPQRTSMHARARTNTHTHTHTHTHTRTHARTHSRTYMYIQAGPPSLSSSTHTIFGVLRLVGRSTVW